MPREEQTCIGGSYAQAMANIWRRCRSIRQAGDRDCSGRESHMALGSPHPISSSRHNQSLAVRSLREFPMTETELKLMAAAAIMGFSSNPTNGYRTPAASGTPRAL